MNIRTEFNYYKIHEYLRKNQLPIMTPDELERLSDDQLEALRAKASFWLQDHRHDDPRNCRICGATGVSYIGLNPNAWFCPAHTPLSLDVLELADAFRYLKESGKELSDILYDIIDSIERVNSDGVCLFCNTDLIQGEQHKEDCLIRRLESAKISNATSPFAV